MQTQALLSKASGKMLHMQWTHVQHSVIRTPDPVSQFQQQSWRAPSQLHSVGVTECCQVAVVAAKGQNVHVVSSGTDFPFSSTTPHPPQSHAHTNQRGSHFLLRLHLETRG
mmetsp:Transcript_80765/g.134992  ORF Transcript_80765/g.134992 Transcript_80765/m.134992 type:complete len:111 (-) Transcript_80765:274-606(-)